MRERKPPVSETELEVLKTLWDLGPATVRALLDAAAAQGRDWAYTTVLTLVGRLESKGYVTADRRGVAHVFTAAVTRDDLAEDRLADLADQVFDGSTSPLLLNLVQRQRLSSDEIAQLRAVLDEAEKGTSGRGR